MSSAGNGLTTQLQIKVLPFLLKNSVYCIQKLTIFIGLPNDIVPATFKKKRVATAPKVKGEEDDEKPSKSAEETERPTGLGRGQR